jgi:signal transduction histidine kinase
MVNLALKSISDVINELRQMSRALLPHTLADLGLAESIRELYAPIKKVQSINVRFYHSSLDEDLLSANLKLTIFRIVQEQLTNIVKHAEAENVVITLQQRDQLLVLEIVDDGKGFNVSRRHKGMGLRNIANRVHLFRGSSKVQSVPGHGCTLTVSIPVKELEVEMEKQGD